MTEDLMAARLPLRSRATRNIPRRSRVSARGMLILSLLAHKRPIKVQFESMIERAAALILAARKDAYDLWDQPEPVVYRKAHGKWGRHTPDFLFTNTSGEKTMIIAKSANRAAKESFAEQVRRIRNAVPVSEIQRICVVTEQTFDRDEIWNLNHLHQFRRIDDECADAAVFQAVAASDEPISIADVERATDLGGRAYQAAVRLIYAGRLVRIGRGKIKLNTLLKLEDVA